MESSQSFEIDTCKATGKMALSFLIGGVVGAAISYYLTKRYYSKLAEKGVADVLERFDRKPEEEPKEVKDIPIPAPVQVEYGPSENPTNDDEPYPIPMNEYTDNDEYDKEDGLVYYEGDDTLTDKYDHILDSHQIFGDSFEELLEHFGDDEKDILYLRNPRMRTDYEICMEHCNAPDYVLMEGDLDD